MYFVSVIGTNLLECRQCNKTFVRPYQLAVHERTHSRQKPFSCPYCCRSYLENSKLIKHITACHVQRENNFDVHGGSKSELQSQDESVVHGIKGVQFNPVFCDRSSAQQIVTHSPQFSHQPVVSQKSAQSNFNPCKPMEARSEWQLKNSADLQHSQVQPEKIRDKKMKVLQRDHTDIPSNSMCCVPETSCQVLTREPIKNIVINPGQPEARASVEKENTKVPFGNSDMDSSVPKIIDSPIDLFLDYDDGPDLFIDSDSEINNDSSPLKITDIGNLLSNEKVPCFQGAVPSNQTVPHLKNVPNKTTTDLSKSGNIEINKRQRVRKPGPRQSSSYNPKTKRFHCPSCKMNFGTKSNLNRHFRQIHLKERAHLCVICRKSFSQRATLEKHIEMHVKQVGGISCAILSRATSTGAPSYGGVRTWVEGSQYTPYSILINIKTNRGGLRQYIPYYP